MRNNNMTQKKGKKILPKVIIRFGLFSLFLFGPIFLGAGTLNFPEAWLYLAISLGYIAIAGPYFYKKNPEFLERRAEMKAEKGWDLVVTILATVFFLSTFSSIGLDYRYGWSSVPMVLKAAGFLVITITYVILFGIMNVNEYLFRVVKVEKGQKVVTTGPYKFVRHPMYLTVLFMFASIPLALGSYYALIPMLFVDAIIIFRTKKEDELLHKELPGYKAYAKKTKYKLIPGV
jgi:protein-S-isoprenylcysteine O-methyltransferase Ste14